MVGTTRQDRFAEVKRRLAALREKLDKTAQALGLVGAFAEDGPCSRRLQQPLWPRSTGSSARSTSGSQWMLALLSEYGIIYTNADYEQQRYFDDAHASLLPLLSRMVPHAWRARRSTC